MEQTATVEKSVKFVYELQNGAELPNTADIEMSVSKFKNGKATGHDQIPAQLIKEGEEELTSHEWKYGIIICPIHQKGNVYTSSVNGISLPTD
jgi:hypothetical protein